MSEAENPSAQGLKSSSGTTSVCRLCGSPRVNEMRGDYRPRDRGCLPVHCEECGCLFHTLDASKVWEYSTEYHAYRFHWLSPKMFLLGKRLLKGCLQAGVRKGTLLDVGCGAGHVLKVGKGIGFTAAGFDIPNPALESLRKSGFPVYDNWETCRQQLAGKCDLVTCWHTLEHVPNPQELLDNLVAMLKPGGVLSLEVPDPDLLLAYYRGQKRMSLAEIACFPEHIMIASRGWAISQLQKRGLVIKKVFTPRDAAFYWVYTGLTQKKDGSEAAPSHAPAAQDPPALKQAMGFFASCVLEPFGRFIVPPVAYHILAQRPSATK